MIGWLQAAAISGIAICSWQVMAMDVRRCRIPLLWVGMLWVSGAVWWAASAPFPGGLLSGAVAGLVMGGLAGFLPILVAHLRRRRWPMMPGDILLLGALGGVTGPWAFPWTLAAGCAGVLGHRFCVQRKRGRAFAKGYLPFAPGFAAGALAVFAGQVAGVVPMHSLGLL